MALNKSEQIPLWRDRRVWAWGMQLLVLGVVVTIFLMLGNNFWQNFQQLGLTFSFDFLVDPDRPASFDIGDRLIAYDRGDPLARALLVGLLNSLRVMGLGIIFASILGISVGVARLSNNWLLRQLAGVYVEIFRNTPLLLQLFFWYYVVFLQLPKADQAISIGNFLSLSNQGLVISLGTLTWTLSPEFATLLTGLTIYTAAFIAEVVRGGIQSVDRGQWEAAQALGLKGNLALRLVIFPQALRVMIPSLTSEYLNLAKNSSLAIAIGFSDIYAIANTIANLTGRAIEMLIVVMATYLALNLLVSWGMNRLNQWLSFET
ncbi:MAG: amino acid ABC transporter permease [Synechocystis sp.]